MVRQAAEAVGIQLSFLNVPFIKSFSCSLRSKLPLEILLDGFEIHWIST
jgi:hypothetical protein